MITLHDLDTAIAKCQGEDNPNAQTCIKLAAFYTIKQEMYGGAEPPPPSYSYDTPPTANVDLDSGSEFSEAIKQLDISDVLAVMDELMSVLQATNPRLYAGVMHKLER